MRIAPCLILCSQPLGPVLAQARALARGAFVIAVDGGARHLKALGATPAAWVGDGDSLPKTLKLDARVPRVKLRRDKDFSDLEAALRVAARALADERWSGDLTLLGAQGGRLDHELGNFIVIERWLLALQSALGAAKCPDVTSVGPRGKFIVTVNAVEFKARRGELFSVFTLDASTAVTISGARYNRAGKPLEFGSHGLSNRGVGKTVRVAVKSGAGTAFVVFPK